MSGGCSTGLWRFRHVICSIQFPVFVISEWNTKSFPWWAALSSFTIVGRCFLSPGSWWFVCIMECGFTIYFCYLTQLHNCLNNTGSLFAQGRLCNSLSKKSPSAKLMMHGLLFSIKYVIAVFFFHLLEWESFASLHYVSVEPFVRCLSQECLSKDLCHSKAFS